MDEFFIEEASAKSLNLNDLDKEVKEVKKEYYREKREKRRGQRKKIHPESGLNKACLDTKEEYVKKQYTSQDLHKFALNSTIGVTISNCIQQQKLVMNYPKQAKKDKANTNATSDAAELKSPRILQKTSEYKSTAEGS
mmetsp:Transcript_29602/g.29193  ORF Transcript_29602/g.29193 Transcript_29602/m.29193 type:complete len:138 (+) Transcript_29602:626-1039(+)|eukprot:CAMPEP_0196995318 /NCGR_PEP_ID=MMETSP1380-20130617/1467_1 /TAXON_ID=5936 /ORGANISM="Euplotes crassus, Strain CT5" /LENGTH=137 /DNA_ID=CAMNT_0042410969 /DNA_START=394 /DNA_END=807 /DNA_ORIENTATION=-